LGWHQQKPHHLKTPKTSTQNTLQLRKKCYTKKKDQDNQEAMNGGQIAKIFDEQ